MDRYEFEVERKQAGLLVELNRSRENPLETKREPKIVEEVRRKLKRG